MSLSSEAGSLLRSLIEATRLPPLWLLPKTPPPLKFTLMLLIMLLLLLLLLALALALLLLDSNSGMRLLLLLVDDFANSFVEVAFGGVGAVASLGEEAIRVA